MKLARSIAIAVAVAAALPAFSAAALSLDEALRVAETRSPQLAAQRAAVEAAAALVPAAREHPDPKLVVGVENVPVEGGDRWSLNRDFMTMRRVGVMQDFVRQEKRDARGAKAEAELQRESALLATRRVELYREVAAAWFERHYAERSRAIVVALMNEAQLQITTSTAELAAGRSPATDAVAARALHATLADRLQDIERQARRATVMLARWLGEDAARVPGDPPLVHLLPRSIRALEVDIERHPELAVYAPLEAAAQAELRLAEAARLPDWSVELSYAQRGSAFTDMVSVMFRMELPIFASRRQDPVAASKRLALEQVRAQNEDARRRHIAEVRAALVDWEAAKAKVERHRAEIVPLAEERARLALSGYAGARSDLATALEARRAAFEAWLAAIAAEAELARAWAQLAFLDFERTSP